MNPVPPSHEMKKVHQNQDVLWPDAGCLLVFLENRDHLFSVD